MTSLVVVWRVTEYCDLGCRFCGYSRSIQRPRCVAEPEQVRSFGAALGEYAAQSRREVLVSWLGGEPLRWPPVWDVSHQFKQEFQLRLGVTTNGTALESATVRQRLAEDFDQLTISIDGLGHAHDAGRGAPGLFERLHANLQSLRAQTARLGRGPRVRVNTILMRDNLLEFESLGRAMAEWGVDELTFNALGGRERPEFYRDHHLWPEQVAWLRQNLPGIRARLAPLGLTLCGGERYLDRIDHSVGSLPIPVVDCQPGQRFLFVDEQGFAGPCSFTTQGYGVPICELRSADDVARLPWLWAERKRQTMLAPCFDCLSTNVFGKFAAA